MEVNHPQKMAIDHLMSRGFQLNEEDLWWLVPKGYEPDDEDAKAVNLLWNYGFGGYIYPENAVL